MFALVAISVLVGAIAQRVTGMGFALVVSPALVLLLGPFDGVLIVNVCGALSAGILVARVWKRIDWRMFALLVVPALVAIVPGSLLATVLPERVLQIGIGVVVIVGMLASVLITRRAAATVSGPFPVIIAGAASGFMNTMAGIGGPAVSVYAVLGRWKQSTFAATMQPYFLVVGSASLLSKLAFSGGKLPDLERWQWMVIVIALLLGLVLGELLDARIPDRIARRVVIVIALLGGVAAIVHGLA